MLGHLDDGRDYASAAPMLIASEHPRCPSRRVVSASYIFGLTNERTNHRELSSVDSLAPDFGA